MLKELEGVRGSYRFAQGVRGQYLFSGYFFAYSRRTNYWLLTPSNSFLCLKINQVDVYMIGVKKLRSYHSALLR